MTACPGTRPGARGSRSYGRPRPRPAPAACREWPSRPVDRVHEQELPALGLEVVVAVRGGHEPDVARGERALLLAPAQAPAALDHGVEVELGLRREARGAREAQGVEAEVLAAREVRDGVLALGEPPRADRAARRIFETDAAERLLDVRLAPGAAPVPETKGRVGVLLHL